jgi:membrane protein DedA with SNARE-associated domain
MSRWSFFGLSFAGTMLWTTLWTLLGYFFGENKDVLTTRFGQYERVALIALALIVVVVLYMSFGKSKKKKK